MKTYRQELRDWLNNKKESTQNEEVNNFINELQKQIKSMEPLEEHMVNRSYIKGYHDSESKRGIISNYYRQSYKQHDVLKEMLSKIN
jgi:hypothetical protein